MERDTLLNIRKNAANTPLHERHQQIDLAKKKSESLEIEEELRTGLIISAVSGETPAITAHKTIVLRKIRSFIDTFITAVKENFESGGVDVKIETKDLRNGDTMITITVSVTE